VLPNLIRGKNQFQLKAVIDYFQLTCKYGYGTVKLTRRKWLAIGVASLAGTATAARANSGDGAGPNRGIEKRAFRGKQTCTNTDVPVSDSSSRLSTPEDFGGSVCEMIADSHEGPYFTCTPAIGKEIAEGQAGQPLTLAMRLIGADCKPIPNGVIDVWACNADGYYSGYSSDPDKLPPMLRVIMFGHIKPDTEDRFCRGALRTDGDGIAEFNTVYPGFYYGQPIHMHFKAHVEGKNLVTSQAHFPEDWNERVMKTQPYVSPRPIERNVSQSGFPLMHVQERSDKLLATLDLSIPA